MTSTLLIKKPELEKEVQEVSVKSFWLLLGELRLDASYYAQEVSRATRLLEESGYRIMPLHDSFSKDVFYLPREKRFFADSNVGEPYLMPSELFFFPFSPSKFVYARKLRKAEEWYVKEGWLLLTRSGKLGKLTLATRSLKEFVVSDDVIRIISQKDSYSGFLYAYLSTWVGNALLTKDQYGVAVDHIEPHHVKTVKVPLFPEEIQRIIHNNIQKAFNLREKSRLLLDKSQEELLRELELPELEKPTKIEPFSVRSSDLKLRFDASYHNPIIDDIHDNLKECKFPPKRVGDNIGEVFIPGRFKRIYVGKDYGIPLLSGTQVVQIKPYDMKYISTKVTKNIENWIVRTGWVLVTCSGTIGRIALVPKEWDGWAISQHVLRIIPNAKEVNNGFLVAFLLSEYGHQQVISKTYGGVVDELAEDDVKDVLIPLPPLDVQKKIGNLVVEAYELKELANKIEDETVKTLESMLTTHNKLEVNEEYLKEINAYADSFELIGSEEFRRSLEDLESGETTSFDDFKKELGF